MNIFTIDASQWYGSILPSIRSFTFTASSTTDLHYLAAIFDSSSHPNMFAEVTKIAFPKLYWFSGVMNNRNNNPSFLMAASLPSLKEISFTLHTAGMTTSPFGERRMLELERTDPTLAKERRLLPLDQLVQKYEFNGLFRNVSLLRISWIDCERTAFFTRSGRASDVMNLLQTYLVDGFRRQGRNVVVEVAKVR
jgi:hypothetical protein